MKISTMKPMTGRMIKSDGTVVNVAELMSSKPTRSISEDSPLDRMSPITGQMLKENGEAVNIADLIEQFVASAGGSVSPEQIEAAIIAYFEEHPIETGATEEQVRQINKNKDDIKTKVDKAQGKEHSGKVLGIGTDGNVTPISVTSGYVPPEKVTHGTSDTTFTLPPNVEHNWDEVSELHLTLQNGDEMKSNIYVVSFISGATPTNLTINPDVSNRDSFTIQPNSRYLVMIWNGIAAVGRGDI